MLIVNVIGLSILIYFIALWFYDIYVWLKSPFPGNFPWPILSGNVYKYIREYGNYHRDVLKDVMTSKSLTQRLWLPGFTFPTTEAFSVSDPETLKKLFVTDYETYDRSVFEQDKLAEFLGGGLILQSNGPLWRRDREIASAAFHKTNLKKFHEKIVNQSSVLIERLKKLEKQQNPKGIDLQNEFQKLLFDLAGFLVLGVDFKSQSMEKSPFDDAWKTLFRVSTLRTYFPVTYWKFGIKFTWDREFDQALSFLDNAIYSEMKSRRQNSTQSNEEIGDALTAFLKHGQELSDKEIRNQLVTLLFAGHDTTTALCSFTCGYLALNPEWQKKCVEEVMEVFGSSPIPSYEDLQSLTIVKAAVKETLRLVPPAPVRGRTALKDNQLWPNQMVKKGRTVAINTYVTHHWPGYWKNPEKFDPSRFLNSETQNSDQEETSKSSFNYLPFGAGKRRCLGEQLGLQEAITIVAMVLYNFPNFKMVPGVELDSTFFLTLHAKNGVPVFLNP